MNIKTKLTEIKENYSSRQQVKNATGETIFEEKNFVRYKEVPYVTGGARFGHYLLDIVFYYIFALILAVPIVILLLALGMDINELDSDTSAAALLDRMISWLVLYPGYYILFESTMQSTPGKLILGRVVVNEYGEKPSFAAILGRSYSRVVPFEAFSCFADLGWHDKWSNTFVIRKTDLKELQLAVKAQEFGNDGINPSPSSL